MVWIWAKLERLGAKDLDKVEDKENFEILLKNNRTIANVVEFEDSIKGYIIYKLFKDKISTIKYMAEKVNVKNIFRCNICDKQYSSQSSLCNHNKKFHKCNSLKSSNNNLKKSNDILISSNQTNNYNCRICNKIFKISGWAFSTSSSSRTQLGFCSSSLINRPLPELPSP